MGAAAERIMVRELDVTAPGTVVALARWLRARHGRWDVLVNNAAVAIDDWHGAADLDLTVARRTLETNLLGAWQLCQAAVPAMRARRYGRIVNVSSRFGQLRDMSAELPSYRISKCALNALTRVLADELNHHGVLVNACCPGRVRTRMTGAAGGTGAAEAADTPVWLATLPPAGPTGGFFRHREPLDW
jgi:NAD(P)-dependent dehydrogenase (short-subunit alcohol dehydrogenase family)